MNKMLFPCIQWIVYSGQLYLMGEEARIWSRHIVLIRLLGG